jgi:sulfite exporter TauE/SafE
VETTLILVLTAVSIGFIHTVLGPDHYVPFVAMSKAGRWSRLKTLVVTLLCGLGHVLSSVIIGVIGAAFGIAVGKLTAFEGVRGGLAAWALISFGLVYMIWGITTAVRNKRHAHRHAHADGAEHAHGHVHEGRHVHVHPAGESAKLTPWVLFTVFVLGPCEPLIPLLMYPALRSSVMGVVYVTAAFAAATILTMTVIVALLSFGLQFVKLGRFERYSHAVAGGVIALSGLAVVLLPI